jgi:hypothetical protein
MFINFFVLFISGGLEKRENTILEDFRRADTLLEDLGRRTGQARKGVAEYKSQYPEDARSVRITPASWRKRRDFTFHVRGSGSMGARYTFWRRRSPRGTLRWLMHSFL